MESRFAVGERVRVACPNNPKINTDEAVIVDVVFREKGYRHRNSANDRVVILTKPVWAYRLSHLPPNEWVGEMYISPLPGDKPATWEDLEGVWLPSGILAEV